MMMQATPIPPHSPFPEVEKLIPQAAVSHDEPVLSIQSPQLPLLHDLLPIDRLHVTKRLRVKNVLCLRGKKNRFFVRTSDQTLMYTIEEENRSWWVGYFCYGLRPLELRVMNEQGKEVMRIHRPFSCTARIFPCQLQHLEIYSPPEQLIGKVEQQWTALRPIYVIKNGDGDTLFLIIGPYMTLSCFRDVHFQIVRPDGTAVGSTCRHWQGLTHALIFAPISDKFGLNFEQNISVEEKGLLLAAALLMDYMYYDA
ncbi:unnamed protein product [Spodoptera littoralis]|uniref:Phospholipid scramblase n=1 Tax=Spodoptera littoralis TaxID=7109 RepID=A0A9P0I9P6_SPOLI|nr:unnamed protein product [Spodoptera littoralis]CAH1643987.1 unnamed protein product [Spodoptera littoralis]